MTNNNSDSGKSNIQSLILFKEDIKETLKKEVKALEAMEQEDQIKLVYELKPYGGNYRYSILLINQLFTWDRLVRMIPRADYPNLHPTMQLSKSQSTENPGAVFKNTSFAL